jgi:hypothetical protein|tara:strand:- start:166 stop:363 length:198 start_codon:yes stop_codon:yes gene_type:complete
MIRFAAVVALMSSFALPTAAEVKFGNNVRIGGHDVSNQTFAKKTWQVHYPRDAAQECGLCVAEEQ